MQDAQVGDIAHGTLVDRIDLLVMAIVNPKLHPQFAAPAASVEASAIPVVLDNNAKVQNSCKDSHV